MIILPAEILTEKGWIDIKNLNIINHKICIYNPKANCLEYENPIGIYIQPVHFLCYKLESPSSCFFVDQSHKLDYVNITPSINNRQVGSTQSCSSYHFCNHATHEQCVTAVKKLFKIDASQYNPEMTGTFKPATMEVANMTQWLCVHAGLKCIIKCDLTGITCSLVDEDVCPFLHGQVKQYGVNITTSTGNYVIRVCSQSSLCECIYSTFVV